MSVEMFDLADVLADDDALAPGDHECHRCDLSFGSALALLLHIDWAHSLDSVPLPEMPAVRALLEAVDQ